MTFKHKLSKRLAMLRDEAVVVSAALILGCEPGAPTAAPSRPVFNSTASQPATVTDLAATATTDTSATLAFTAIDDGAGLPANYDVRLAVAPLSWGLASSASQGSCKTPLSGAVPGSMLTCTVLGLQPGTTYEFQLVAFRGTLDVDAVFGELSNIARATTKLRTPGTVTDLAASGATDTSMTLTFTEVNDGMGRPASYDVRFGVEPLSWGSASSVERGTCKTPVAGTSIGATRSCKVRGLNRATRYQFQLVAFRDTLNVNAVFSALSNVAAAATQVAKPGTVNDLAVINATDSSITLSFAEVGNGTGAPASYDVRLATGTISWCSAHHVTPGSCATPVAGSAIGAKPTCTVLGIAASTGYQFQLVAFRGTLNVDAVFGVLSNVASSSTTAEASTVASVASVTVSPSTVSQMAGTTQQFSVALKDSTGADLSGRPVTWTSSSPAVASVTSTGLEASVAPGTATITATSEGQSGAAAITVTVVSVASVAVSPATATVVVGQTAQLTATPKDASGNPLSGRVVTWASGATAVATVNGSGLVTGVSGGSATMTATSEGKSGTAAITVSAAVANPGTVANLAVASVTANAVTLSFTEVTNGAGQPASYDIRWAQGTLSWASATSVAQGTCSVPLAGTTIGATRSCTVAGLTAATSYQFQLVAFRGTLNVDAVFGGLSNVASGTTANSTAPVATVTVSPASVSLGVGATQSLTATMRDASGNILTGRTVTWASSAPLLATVGGSGLVTGVAVGTASITATSEGQSGTATVTVVTSLPGGEPLFDVATGDALIYQDNMDQYTTPHDMDSWPGYSLHPFYPDLYPNNYAVITSAHGGSGKALRLVYDKGNGDRFIWKTNPENISSWYAPGNAAFVVQYWFRISKNGGPGGGPGYGSTAVGMKWVEFWNVGGGARTQFSVTLGDATTGPLWHVNPASRGPVGYQPVGPYWNQLNNNQWHRVTYQYQPASSPGATDGVARMWVDGTKIVDVSAAAAGITPPGGTKVWCTLAEVATLDVAQTGMINLGEYMNGGLGDGVTDLPMALDFDDFMWWKLPTRIR